MSVPAFVAEDSSPYRRLPMVYVATAALQKFGWISQPNSAYFYVPKPTKAITSEQEDRARNVLAADIGSGYFAMDVEGGPEAVRVLQKIMISSIVLLALISAALAFITVALAMQELRPDMSALAAAGADRRFRSLLSGLHAGQVTAIGTVIGLMVTVASVPPLLAAMGVGWSLWPWLGLLAAAVGGVGASVLAGRIGGARVGTLLRRAR